MKKKCSFVLTVIMFGAMVGINFLSDASAKVECSYDTFEGYKACRALFDEMMNLPVPQSDNVRELNKVFFAELEKLYNQKKAAISTLSKLYARQDAKPEDISKAQDELQQIDTKIQRTIGAHSEKTVNMLLPMQKIKYKEVRNEFERLTNPNK